MDRANGGLEQSGEQSGTDKSPSQLWHVIAQVGLRKVLMFLLSKRIPSLFFSSMKLCLVKELISHMFQTRQMSDVTTMPLFLLT